MSIIRLRRILLYKLPIFNLQIHRNNIKIVKEILMEILMEFKTEMLKLKINKNNKLYLIKLYNDSVFSNKYYLSTFYEVLIIFT